MQTALIILADGFEEIEAVTVIDILRRAGIDLTVAGLDKTELTGEQGLQVVAETTLDTVTDKAFDIVVLPGGDSGVDELATSQEIKSLIAKRHQNQQLIAAICGAPRLLDEWGILDGRRATSYPETKPAMKACRYVEDRVVCDGHILTSRAPGTAMAFAYAILEALGQTSTANSLRAGMLYQS
jgi:protein deglycase